MGQVFKTYLVFFVYLESKHSYHLIQRFFLFLLNPVRPSDLLGGLKMSIIFEWLKSQR